MDPSYQQPPQQQPPQAPPVGGAPAAAVPPVYAPPVETTLPTPTVYAAATPTATPAPAPQYSTDYLNQIAVKEAPKAPNKLAIIALIGGVLLAALFAILLVNGSKAPDTTSQLVAIRARVGSLKTAGEAQKKRLAENSINATNATLVSTLTTMETSLGEQLPEKTETTKEITTKEKTYADELVKTLDNAYQRGTLDRNYTMQMNYELTILRGMLVKLQQNSTKDTTKTFCATSITNIDSILKQYSEFSAAKS